MNPFIGLIVNMIILFVIVYQSVDNYKSQMHFPFVISYIFMLMSSPATYEQLPLRVISIIIGSIYVLLVQVVLNKNRLKKTISGTRAGITYNLNQQIDSILLGKYNYEISKNIDSLFNTTVKAIYDKRSKNKYLTQKNKGNLEIAISLHNLSNELKCFENSYNLNEDDKYLLRKIKGILGLVNKYFSSHMEKEHVKKEINLVIKEIKKEIKSDEIKVIINTIDSISTYLELTEEKTDKSLWKKELILANTFKKIDRTSVEYKFALKMAVTVSISVFVISIFDITYGRWMIFPMIAIIQPYYDFTFTKSINRIIGTILGIIVFTIIFTIVKEPSIRMNITILVAYIGLFITKYQYSTSMVAISALGASAMGGAGVEILFYRILFTIVGCAIAMLANKYILHYKISDSIGDLKVEYKNKIQELNCLENKKDNETKRYNIILKMKLMEHKINLHKKDEGYA